MVAEDRTADGLGAGGADAFEEELTVRLGARARGVSGRAPLADLRRAGQRRARHRTVARVVAGAAVLALGAGALTQIGGGAAGGTARVAAVGGSGAPELSWEQAGLPILGCPSGPTANRTPGWTGAPKSSGSASGSSSGGPTSGSSSGWPGGSASGSSPGWPTGSSSGGPTSGSSSGWPGGPSSAPSTGPWSGSPSSSGSASAPAGRPSPGWPRNVELFELSRVVVELAATEYRDQYFGACSDSSTLTLYVMRVPGGDFDRAVTERVAERLPGSGARLRFWDAAGPRSASVDLVNRITADAAGYWKERGVDITNVSLCLDGAGVRVDSPQADSARAEITARYGRLVAEVVRVG
ncbi:hypothetical protein [Kitasatospora sp. NPDC059327]|uniref:hypothetical protein n=1 Tax=Kitasatospora sp. NPDC059327 TaxID=3346803 RepID=UPI00367F1736